MLRRSWDSVKQAASALASVCHKVVDFKPKARRFANRAFDDDMINIPRKFIQNQCVFKGYGYHFDAA